MVITLFKNYTPNYLDKENNVRFYNGYRLVTNNNDTEIISIHKSNSRKAKWEEINEI